MSAADDFPVLASASELVHGSLGRECTLVLAELDELRRGNPTARIEALRSRAQRAEALVAVLVRACRPEASREAREAAVAAHEVWLAEERVA